MKKLMIAALVLASAVSEAKTTFTVKGKEIDAYQYVTNFVANESKLNKQFIQFDSAIRSNEVDRTVLEKCDLEMLKCTKNIYPFKNLQELFPLTYTNNVLKLDDTVDGVSVAYFRKNDGTALSRKEKATLAISRAYIEMSNNRGITDKTMNQIVNGANYYVIAKIRKDKLAYAGEQGRINIEGYVNNVKNALNAYRLEGLYDALCAIDMDYGIKFENMLYTEDEIQKIESEILAGDRVMNKVTCEMLRTHLGVDKYNEFIREYNGTEE